MGKRIGLILVLVSVFVGCSEGHCRRKKDPAHEAIPVEASGEAVVPMNAVKSDRVMVYKYDGSLQCGMGKVISLDEMAKELKGVTIYSSVKKRDGLMHIQVCGSITGMANVYEIPTEQLKRAESHGFKKWSFE